MSKKKTILETKRSIVVSEATKLCIAHFVLYYRFISPFSKSNEAIHTAQNDFYVKMYLKTKFYILIKDFGPSLPKKNDFGPIPK